MMKEYQGFNTGSGLVSMDGISSPCGGQTRIAVATSPHLGQDCCEQSGGRTRRETVD
jgi:hypothetical protein